MPQKPYCEQHVPKIELVQVYSLRPPQVPSVEGFLAGVGVGVADFLVLVAMVVEGLAEEAGFTEETAGGAEDTAAAPAHVPKAVLQPVPQYASVEPHHPEVLQQFPKVDPWQV